MVMTFWVGHFTHYVTAYGSLGALIGVMIWIWLSAIVVLAGAELNAALAMNCRFSAAETEPAWL